MLYICLPPQGHVLWDARRGIKFRRFCYNEKFRKMIGIACMMAMLVCLTACGSSSSNQKTDEKSDADLYEIVPEEPYTDDDLNYSDRNTRATAEQDDKNVRPAISGSVENMEQYKIVFLAFPIWWGEEPRIMDTFVESYDFSGKTIVPFCTSGGSGIGSSGKNMQNLSTGDATWLDGERLSSSSSREDMVEWINGLGLDVEAK